MSNLSKERFVFLLARYGSFSIGVVYITVGVMAMLSLLRIKKGGADEDSILDFMASIPFGKVVIVILLLGLLAYIAWKIYEALEDPYEFGRSKKAIAKRIGIALGALAYGMIGYSAIEALLNIDPNLKGTPDEQRFMVAKLLTWEGGKWIIIIAGLIVAIAGLVEFKYMVSQEYKLRLRVERLGNKQKKMIRVLAWAGHMARAVILCIIAYFLVQAAFQSDPGDVVNTDKAFNFLGESVLGHPSFVAVALGTISYGLYMFILAWYYDFDKD